MAIPDFQSMMLPLLRFAGDGMAHTMSEVRDHLAGVLGLSDAERAEMLPSGTQRTFDNRVYWASAYLRHAQLLERPARAQIRITERGKQVLGAPPEAINVAYLKQFPEFVQFISGDDGSVVPPIVPLPVATETPEELMERAYVAWRSATVKEMMKQLRGCDPAFFERLVIDVLLAMGYGGSRRDAAHAVGKSGDGGIDGIIHEDRLGLDAVYVQAKRWEGSVGRPTVQAFAGSLEGRRARKGILITTSTFADTAVQYVNMIEKRIVLIDGRRLAELMLDFGVGVQEKTAYRIYRIDDDYFSGNE